MVCTFCTRTNLCTSRIDLLIAHLHHRGCRLYVLCGARRTSRQMHDDAQPPKATADMSQGDSTPQPRFLRRNLRQSTYIQPRTGERVRRVFTLRDPSPSRSTTQCIEDESAPLLPGNGQSPQKYVSWWHRALVKINSTASQSWNFVTSKTGQGILKCSVAYLLGSLATFVPAISNLIGKQDGKHIVATVTVYFHPARSIGSMHEATILAFIAFLYSAFISFTSMGISMFFGQHDLLVVGHAIVLTVFCGGGLGFVGWLKQKLGNPLVNVACSLASLGIITTLVREGSVQTGDFSDDKVVQVLIMVAMGIFFTTLVNVLILPVSARSELCRDFTKNTDLLGDLLISVTRAFLSGQESELQDPVYRELNKAHQASLNSMKKNLSEARSEHFFLGTERQARIERKLVTCLQRLSQDLGGLRSAASTQFTLIGQVIENRPKTPVQSPRRLSSPAISPAQAGRVRNILETLHEDPEETEDHASFFPNGDADGDRDRRPSLSPADMFGTFITQLGPSTKSLAYTLKQVLDELPFVEGSIQQIAINENFHQSLEQAVQLYKGARKEALSTLYQSRELSAARSVEGVADVEEVSASCGHFSFSLLDFAEDLLRYLNILEELKAETERSPKHRSWRWLLFWRRGSHAGDDDSLLIHPSHDASNDEEEQGLSKPISSPLPKPDAFSDPEKAFERQPWTYRLYKACGIFRRDDTKFGIKIGVGAALFALPAFVSSTRPIYSHWRGVSHSRRVLLAVH